MMKNGQWVINSILLLRPGDKTEKLRLIWLADFLIERVRFCSEISIPGITRALGKILEKLFSIAGLSGHV